MKKWMKVFLFLILLNIKLSGHSDSLKTRPEGYFSLNYDNDFFAQTDRYYTQGISMDLTIPLLRKNPLTRLLLKSKPAKKYYGLKIQQDGFTPRSIRHDSIYLGERPYASVLFISSYIVSIDKAKKQYLSSSIDLGLIGPYGKGEEEQKAIHRGLNNLQPLGWEYQIKNDVVINYNVQWEKGLMETNHFEFNSVSGFRVGTLYDDIDLGFGLRCGLMQSYFENMGLSKNKSEKKFQCYIFIRELASAVGYNATLQGGLFNKNSVYVIPGHEIQRVVSNTSLGIVVSFESLAVEFAETYLTPEFKNGLDHGWGHCKLMICF